jgi:hypothetical protein
MWIKVDTVKPVLTATSEQRPPVNNGQTKSGQANFDTNFDLKTSTERSPMYNGQFLGVPRVAVAHRFDCTCISFKDIHMTY